MEDNNLPMAFHYGNSVSDKKVIRLSDGPNPPPAMPRNMKRFIINTLDGDYPDLLFQKKLSKSDVNSELGRLMIPIRRLRLKMTEFLTQREIDGLDQVTLIDPMLRVHRVDLKEKIYSSVSGFVFTNNWSKVVYFNGLVEDHVIQIWFFRDIQSQPCFALVNLGPH